MTYAKVSSKLSPVKDVPLTVLRASYPITKQFEVVNGELIKAPAQPVASAKASVYTCASADGLLNLLNSLTPLHAVLLGRFMAGEDVDVVSHEPVGGQVRRNKESTEFPTGACWCVLDVDKAHCVKEYHTPEEVHAALVSLAPCLEDVDCLVTSSTSSGIYFGETQLRGYGGWHVWFRLARGTDWPDFVAWLMARCWMFGQARHIVSASGVLLERGLIDASVSSPERIQYAAPPSLGEGLRVVRRAGVFGTSGVELNHWKRLSADDKREVEYKKKLSETSLAGVQKERRDEWVLSRVRDMGGAAGDLPLTGVAVKALEARHLGDQWMLVLDTGERVSVGDVLAYREKYDERKCLDPIEPEYDGSKVVGKIYSSGGRVRLHSMAHGGATYTLGGDVNVLSDLQRVLVYVKEDKLYVNRENPLDFSSTENINVMYAKEYGYNKTAKLLQERGVECVQRRVWWPGKPVLYDHEGIPCLNSCPDLLEGLGVGVGVDVGAGGVDLWVDHVGMLWGSEAEWFLDYLAFAIQNPSIKQNAHPMLGGRQGVGKDATIYPLKKWFGRVGTYGEVATLPDILDFDDQLVWKKWVCITEFAAKDMDYRTAKRALTKLKPMLAGTGSEVQTLNPKSKGRVYQANVSSFVMFTNEPEPLALESDDRRYVFHWHVGLPRPPAYFDELFGWFDDGGVGVVMRWLARRDWRARGYNPAAPAHMTLAKSNVVIGSAGSTSDLVEQCMVQESLNGAVLVSVSVFVAIAGHLNLLDPAKSVKSHEVVVRHCMAEYATRNGVRLCKVDTKTTSRTFLVINEEKAMGMNNTECVECCKELENVLVKGKNY